MTKNDNAIDGQVLTAILGRWRGVCLAAPLLGLLGGCASNGETRVTFDNGPDGLFAGVDRPSQPVARQDAGARVDSAAAAKSVTASQASAPKPEVATSTPRKRGGSYVVFGKRYSIDASSEGHVEKGLASWYGGKFHGRRTASGERYDMHGYTAAHKSLPLPTYAEVTNLVNGRSILVKVNDRGPFVGERVIDLSYAAAQELQMVEAGVAMVEVRAIDPGEMKIDENMFLAANQRSAGGEARAEVADGAETEGGMRLAAADGGSAGESEPRLAAAVAETQAGDLAGTTPLLASVTTGPGLRPAAAGPAGKLYVKAGEFGNLDSAERLRRRLTDHLAEQVEVRVSDGFLSRYAVQIGPLASPAQAKDVSEQLVALGVTETATAVE